MTRASLVALWIVAVAAAQNPAGPPKGPETEAEEGDRPPLRVKVFGTLVLNSVFNSSSIAPGNLAFFVYPSAPPFGNEQFSISPGNTVGGLLLDGPRLGGWKLDGRVVANLRGQTPVVQDNFFAPFFADVSLSLRNGVHHVLAGQSGDLMSPHGPRTLNLAPAGELPGTLGASRPQVRYELGVPVGGGLGLLTSAAIAESIQTFRVSDELVAVGTGIPDGQLRLALVRGLSARTFELGVGGHAGRRRITRVEDLSQDTSTTWSAGGDVYAKLGVVTLEAEGFVGAVLGDYGAGILHTFNPVRDTGMRAFGAHGSLDVALAERVTVGAGYGVDRTFDDDLSPGFRARNEAVFANVFYALAPRLRLAVEGSLWRTRWVELPVGEAARLETALLWELGGD